MICSPVYRLFPVCGPPAVIGIIIAVVVDAFKFVTFRPFPHIGKKVLKRIFPTITDSNPSSAIILITDGLWVKAALFHLRPRVQCGGLLTICGMSMTKTASSFSAIFGSPAQASTTLCVTVAKAFARYYDFRSAYTTTEPSRFSFFVAANATKGSQSSENTTSNIFKISSRWSKNIISHFASFIGTVVRAVSGRQLIDGSPIINPKTRKDNKSCNCWSCRKAMMLKGIQRDCTL